MDEHMNQNSDPASDQIRDEQPQNGQGNPPEQPNSQEKSQFQQYLKAEEQEQRQQQGQQIQQAEPQGQDQQSGQWNRQPEQQGQFQQQGQPFQQPEQQGQFQQQGQPFQPSEWQSPYQQQGTYQQNQSQQTGWQNPYQQGPYQQQYQQPYQQNSYQQTPPKQSNGMALASMIVGIFALLTCCIPFIQFPLAVISVVLVILSKKGKPLHGFAIAGLVMAIISILISIGMTFYWGYVIKLMNDPEFMEMYNELMEMYQ